MNFLKKQPYQDWKTKLVLAAVFLSAALFFCLLFRALLLWNHPHVFSSVTGPDVVRAFLNGFRFDLSVVCLFLGPFLFLLFLPVKSSAWTKTFACLSALVTAGLLAVLLADYAYFPQAKRHMAEELLNVWGEKQFLLHYAWDQCKRPLLYVLLTLAAGLAFALLYIRRNYAPKPLSWTKNMLILLAAGSVLLFGFRGRLDGKPLGMRDIASLSSGAAHATLTFNGIFTAYHTLRKSGADLSNPYPEAAALQRARQLLLGKNEFFPDPAYPLMRQIKNPGPFRPLNVFVVLLESWTPRYIDSLSGAHYGVTPNFDQIAQKGVTFTNAYAAGVRSIFGLSAAVAGVPLVPGLPYFTHGLELNSVTSLPDALNARGYYTAFAQSSLRSSYQMCAISKNIFHVQESFGMEDLPRLMDYREEQDFGYDYDLLQFAAGKAAASFKRKQPFFIFTFTGTTHAPFNETVPRFQKYPGKTDEQKYLNNLFYADYSVGALLDRARAEGWADDTVFIFMADHTLVSAQKDDRLKEKFRIPFVIYAPKYLKPRRLHHTVSQLDLIPTLFHLLQMDTPFTALGKDALDDGAPRFALISEGTNIALAADEDYLRHNRRETLEASAPENGPRRAQMEDAALALDKSVTALFARNAWHE